MKIQKTKGQIGEDLALRYLRARGYGLISRNWRKKEGEIDLIVYDNVCHELVFVEVKQRSSSKFGCVAESISVSKMRKLTNIINRYINETGFRGKYRCDFIGIWRQNKLLHYKNLDFGY